ncbi:DUF2637 domain-containing protein [Streptomyces spororaveus]|uniref:DUF2637 domain-containing protein n=1 Tax=Streptomyces spororaveus TaxID=284039 RepID=UPI003686D448
MVLTRTHRILISVVVVGAVIIAGIGFAGSYAAVRELAVKKGFGGFSLVFPIGIDAGICVLLALDLLLTWLRIPFPLLRQTAWLLTAATIAFNGAASWPDPLGVGMHAVIPILFVVTVEAARHAVGRIADITADRHMEGVRITRWLLSPVPTFKLWRRMKLWELRSYEQAVGMEQDRLIYQARLQARYGRSWRRKAPVEALMPLKLARIGVPLSETAAEGLVAAGMDPVLLQRRPAATAPEEIAPAVAPALPAAVSQPDEVLVAEQLSESFENSAGGDVPSVQNRQTLGLSAADLRGVGREFIEQYDRFPTADQLAGYLAQQYGVTDPATGGLIADEYLESVLTDLRELGFDPDSVPVSNFAEGQADPDAEPDGTSVSAAEGTAPVAERPHSFWGEPSAGSGLEAETPRLAPATKSPVPVATASAKAALPMQGTVEQKSAGETSRPTPAGEAQPWTADVTETGEATVRVPQQQNDERDVDPIQQEIELVAKWLAEAEDAGKKLSGAETARRLGVSPKTGQRRVLEAAKHLEESRQRQGRAHLRSVRS